MGKKIFAVLLLLSFACAGLQAQNNKKSNKDNADNVKGRVKRDIEMLDYTPVRKITPGDSLSKAQMVLELAKNDNGATSLSTLLATYTPFILPPLDELFERAKKNPAVVYKMHEMDHAWREVVSARMDWLKWFHGDAAYSYGKYNSNMYYQQTNIPTANTYSNQNSSYYLVGGGVTINLYDIVNLKNKISQQKDGYYAAMYQYKAAYETALENINKAYQVLMADMPLLSQNIQFVKLAELTYEDAKLDFINGRYKTADLFDCHMQYYRAMQELSALIRDINTEVKYLELITDSRIVPDNKETSSVSNDVSDINMPSNSSGQSRSTPHKRKKNR